MKPENISPPPFPALHYAHCAMEPLANPAPKSARWSLSDSAAFWRKRPPYVVVWLWGSLGWLLLALKLLNR